MASPTNFPGDVTIPGNLRVTGSITPLKDKTDVLAVSEEQPYVVPWSLWRAWDDAGLNLLEIPATDDLGVVGGTFGTDVPSIQTVDFGGTSTTAYARVQINLPPEYVAAATVKLRFHAGAITTLPDTTLTLDVEAYKSGEKAVVSGGDICATTIQDINSLTMADVDFTITAAALSPGDTLDVRIVMNGVDGGDLGVMRGVVGAVQLLCNVR